MSGDTGIVRKHMRSVLSRRGAQRIVARARHMQRICQRRADSAQKHTGTSNDAHTGKKVENNRKHNANARSVHMDKSDGRRAGIAPSPHKIIILPSLAKDHILQTPGARIQARTSVGAMGHAPWS